MTDTLTHLRNERMLAYQKASQERSGLFTANLLKPYWLGVAEGLRVAIETLENEQ